MNRAIRPIATVVQGALCFHVAVSVADIVLFARVWTIASRGPGHHAGDFTTLARLDELARAQYALSLAATLATAVLFGVWIGRSRDHVVAAGRGVPDSSNVIRWGWLLPFFQFLVWPRRVLAVWQAADPDLAVGERWNQRPRSPVGVLWYASLAASVVLVRLTVLAVDDAEAFRSWFWIGLAGEGLRLVACFAAVVYVGRLTDRVEALPVPGASLPVALVTA